MLFIKRILVLSFIVLFFNTSVFASGIEGSYGFGFATGSYQLKASEGTVDGEVYTSPIHLFYMAEMGSTSRLNVEFFHYDIKFKSKPAQTLGTTVLNSGVNFLYEEELKFSNFFKPILGAGLQLSKVVQTARFKLDAQGFRIADYPDKDDFAASMLVSAGYDVHITDNMVLYARVLQTLGISNDLSETQILFAFMFRK